VNFTTILHNRVGVELFTLTATTQKLILLNVVYFSILRCSRLVVGFTFMLEVFSSSNAKYREILRLEEASR
jgi:hypothetical protein